jgi:hypothetical protein
VPSPVNLVSLRPLPGVRHVIQDESDTWREVASGYPAAIAEFRNEALSVGETASIDGLTAQIAYFEDHGGEVHRVHRGCWLRDPFNHTRLGIGATAELLLAVEIGDSVASVTNNRTNAANYETEVTESRALERRIYDVTVRLVAHARREGDFVGEFRFNLDLTEQPRLGLGWTRKAR